MHLGEYYCLSSAFLRQACFYNDGEYTADIDLQGMVHEPMKSILYFERKDNPVKHIVALCSIVWQGNQGKMSEKQKNGMLSTHCHDMLRTTEALPKDASQHHVARLPWIGLGA